MIGLSLYQEMPIMKPYQVIYQTETPVAIRTLSHAIRVLNSVPQPILRYRQHISVLAPELDLCFSGIVRHDRENQILRIGFPSELVGVVSRIRNSHGCRMVTYWKDPVTDFIQEVEIGKETQINCLRWGKEGRQEIRIDTRGVEDLVVSFDVWLFKMGFFWRRAAL